MNVGTRNSGHRLTLLTALVLGTTACTTTATSEPSLEASPVDMVFLTYIHEATLAEAGEAQIAVLEEAGEKGVLTGVAIAPLYAATIECFEANGVDYVEWEPREVGPDMWAPNFGYSDEIPGLTETQGLAIADRCLTEHITFALLAMQTQPVAVSYRDERFAAQIPQVIECLRAAGSVIPETATPEEVREEVFRVTDQTSEASAGQNPVICHQFW